jgi:3-methyladenine DNA glycosylase AlkD
MQAYMKNVATFLGIRTVQRRAALRVAWRELEQPTSDELGETCLRLMQLEEREYHYASCELVGRFLDFADERFLV